METLFRHHLTCLPTIISTFSKLPSIWEYLEIPPPYGSNKFVTRLDLNGDLWIDIENAHRLQETLNKKKFASFSPKLEGKLKRTISNLEHWTNEVSTSVHSKSISISILMEILKNWSNAMEEYVLWPGLITKLMPDIIYDKIKYYLGKNTELKKMCDHTQPVLNLPSGELNIQLLKLAIFLLRKGIDLKHLTTSMLDTRNTSERVKSLQVRVQWNGPREIELPGMESKGYIAKVTRNMFSAYSVSKLQNILEKLQKQKVENKIAYSNFKMQVNSQIPGSCLPYLLSLYESVVGTLEEEHVTVRRNFYIGLFPLLRKIGEILVTKGKIERISDILFLLHNEVLDWQSTDYKALIMTRKSTYYKIAKEEKYPDIKNRLEDIINENYKR